MNPNIPEKIENKIEKNMYCLIFFAKFLDVAAGKIKREFIKRIPTHLTAIETTMESIIVNVIL